MTLLLGGGALRFTECDFFQEQVVKFIVMKRVLGSATESDCEFMDWNALAGFLDDFHQWLPPTLPPATDTCRSGKYLIGNQRMMSEQCPLLALKRHQSSG